MFEGACAPITMPGREIMRKKVPDQYFFIHYIEPLNPIEESSDCISLNGIGYLYIGHAECTFETYEQLKYEENTYFNIEDARSALAEIRRAFAPSN